MLIPLKAFDDNYIWIYAKDDKHILVIDPGDAEPVLTFLNHNKNLILEAILLTHHHHDHTGGISALQQEFPQVNIYGSQEVASIGANKIIHAGKLETEHYTIEVIETPGHTLQHVCYVVDNILFSGDTLFSAGCGRMFEGSYPQFFASLNKLKQLPDATQVCPGHEYTLANLNFVASLAKAAPEVLAYREKVNQLRQNEQPSVPSIIALEKQINPFLQANTVEEFSQLRQAKDIF